MFSIVQRHSDSSKYGLQLFFVVYLLNGANSFLLKHVANLVLLFRSDASGIPAQQQDQWLHIL